MISKTRPLSGQGSPFRASGSASKSLWRHNSMPCWTGS